jgi:cell filamentation protein
LKRGDRYDASDLPEAQFEPRSNGQVLKNRLGITSKQEMDDAEAVALEKTMDELVRKYGETHRFTAADIRECHQAWLGDIYEWAGRYRQVNISKEDFPFAAAAQIPSLMEQFERDVLRRCTPCSFADRTDVIRALGEAHVELVLIHPFREGNGRLAWIIHEHLLQQPILSPGAAFLVRPPRRTASTPASPSLARSHGGLRPRLFRYGIHE